MSEAMHFDDEPIEIPITVLGTPYVLREATSRAAARWRNYTIECATLGANGKAVKLVGIADTEALLVSLCVFTEQGQSVDPRTVAKWGNRIVKPLFAKAKEISDLDEGPTERELLQDALSDENTPPTNVSLDMLGLRAWVGTLPQEKFGPLVDWLKPTPEERAKNELADSENS